MTREAKDLKTTSKTRPKSEPKNVRFWGSGAVGVEIWAPHLGSRLKAISKHVKDDSLDDVLMSDHDI